jgi:hypothetical protein
MLISALFGDNARSAPRRSALLAVCRSAGGAPAEVGIEYRAPGTAEWLRHHRIAKSAVAHRAHQPSLVFSAASHPGSGSHAILLIPSPEAGSWEFRAYLVDYPSGHDDGRSTDVKLAVSHSDDSTGVESGLISLREPGETGEVVSLTVAE